ncbi:MAG: Gfo/Idh/MocA family oxidoreductase [Pirellulales bacterium]|nr:Gfo/Idh/MocA family oxidoreductase [Pirellulales bacterium]
MSTAPENKPVPVQGDVSRRDFLKGGVAATVIAGGGLGAFYFGYEKSLGKPVRVGVIGTGDEGSVLIGALNPNFIQVASIADIRPYNVWRAFYGDNATPELKAIRSGLLSKYGWKTQAEAQQHVKVYDAATGGYPELIKNARQDGIEGVIIALPLHLHAPAAIAAMKAGLHVMTEKLMGHSVHECKEMARAAQQQKLLLATGHQRHYNILYANAMEQIRRGTLGDLHYLRAQWHRGNLPGNDSWQQPLPPGVKPKGKSAADDKLTAALEKKLADAEKELSNAATGKEIDAWRLRVEQLKAQLADAAVEAKKFDYRDYVIKDDAGKTLYEAPALEELIRWRLFDRTGAGLMAELGSHQLDAASLFIAAAHGGEKKHPLAVAASASRPLFPADRDVEDHVYCLIDFPAPGYDPKNPIDARKKIGVQYASINGNGFGGYGEIVYGTKRALVLEREKELTYVPDLAKVSVSSGAPAALDTQASGPAAKVGKAQGADVSRGYTEELEHWAWCIRNRSPENLPRCHPKVALGDAVIALVTNMAARQEKRIEFKEEWFDIASDETPEGVKPDLTRYA